MKVLFFQPVMGAAGDMINACLFDLLDEKKKKEYLDTMNSLGLPDVSIEAKPGSSNGIAGMRMNVLIHGREEDDFLPPDSDPQSAGSEDHDHVHHHDHDHDHVHHHDHDHDHGHHHDHDHGHDGDHCSEHDLGCGHDHNHAHPHSHASLKQILDTISSLPVSKFVQNEASEIYRTLAEAEARAHGVPAGEIHFHEVGTTDAIADIVGCCLLIEMIHPDRIYSSPVCTGYGLVKCAHGMLPVPAPATAALLEGIPVFSGEFEGEMCTPTGAALLAHFADSFEEMPQMRYDKIGCGLGKRQIRGRVSLLRCFLGADLKQDDELKEQIVKLECTLDDMTGEQIAFGMERLFEAGAKDVFTTAVGMKKSRPGVLLSVLCLPEDAGEMVRTLFKYTSTLGIRESAQTRRRLERRIHVLKTEDGDVRVKSACGYGVNRSKFEYEDLAAAARKLGVSLPEAAVLISKSARPDQFEEEEVKQER